MLRNQKSRVEAAWTDPLIARVAERAQAFEFLRPYEFPVGAEPAS